MGGYHCINTSTHYWRRRMGHSDVGISFWGIECAWQIGAADIDTESDTATDENDTTLMWEKGWYLRGEVRVLMVVIIIVFVVIRGGGSGNEEVSGDLVPVVPKVNKLLILIHVIIIIRRVIVYIVITISVIKFIIIFWGHHHNLLLHVLCINIHDILVLLILYQIKIPLLNPPYLGSSLSRPASEFIH